MINAIFAADANGGMGLGGTLPWPHNSEDLSYFRTMTEGHVVVMGRRTWDDPKLPKPLNGRIVYVASHNHVNAAGRIQGNIADEVLKLEQQHPGKIIWVVGGVRLLETCCPILDRIYLTHFKGQYKIDTKIDLRSFLLHFTPIRADVAQDKKSTRVIYEPIFNRAKTSS